MTEEEVEKYFGEAITIQAPGIVAGWKKIKIVDYDFSKQTPNGKGIVKYENIGTNRPKITCSLTQIRLYEQPTKSKRGLKEKKSRRKKR